MSIPDRSSDFPSPSSRAGTACFSILAHHEPGTLPRLIAPFAQRSLVPDRWHGAVTDDGALQVDIQVDGLAQADADLIAAKLRALIDVPTVLTCRKS
jgi:acetolactate synthase small subunit